jgi:hypothetical protein
VAKQKKACGIVGLHRLEKQIGGSCEPISAPLFMSGEPTHSSFFAAISCDKNRNLCDISAEKRE